MALQFGLYLVCALAAHSLTISNMIPKLDQAGNIMDAHDGTYRKFGKYWYYHAAEYGLCIEPPGNGCDQTSDRCGFNDSHNVSIWRSPDLSSGSWEFVAHAMHCRDLNDCGTIYRPHLVFNPTTLNYTLFVNFVRKSGGYGGFAVYTSASPEGPFDLRNPVMNISRLCPSQFVSAPCGPAQGGVGDFDVFVDDDNQGYVIYGSNYWTSIERLSPDFLTSTGQNASAGGPFNGTVFPDYFVEAPAMFKRNGLYYVLYGHCCCFCYQGSGILVYTAPHPMGPWTAQAGGDLSCVKPAEPMRSPAFKSLGNGSCRDNQGVEPPFFNTNGMITADECAGYCAVLGECRGFSYCTDKCPGVCNLYMSEPVSAPDTSTNWHYNDRNGSAARISQVTAEPWWNCYLKNSTSGTGSPNNDFGLSATAFGGQDTPGQGCLYNNSVLISSTRAQQNFVIEVPLKDGTIAYVWTGDRWQQSPDSIKGHEGQFWTPLVFEGNIIQPVVWIDSFSLDIA